MDDLFAEIAPAVVVDDDELSEIYFELLARLRADPSALSSLEAILSAVDAESPIARISISALVALGSPEAQATMSRLLGARMDDDEFLKLMVPAAGFTAHPTKELEQALLEVAGQHPRDGARQMADLALGNLASQLSESDPERSARIVTEYDAMLARTSDADAIENHLAALGNAATSEAASVIERYLTDERSSVRAEAVEALRLVASDEANTSVLQVLREDSDPSVRASAAWALSHRQPTVDNLEAQAHALAAEQNARVAGALLDNLWVGRQTNPDLVIARIRQFAAEHPLASVRARAKRMLAGLDRG